MNNDKILLIIFELASKAERQLKDYCTKHQTSEPIDAAGYTLFSRIDTLDEILAQL